MTSLFFLSPHLHPYDVIVLPSSFLKDFLPLQVLLHRSLLLFQNFFESSPFTMSLHCHEVPLVFYLLLPRSPHHLVLLHLLLSFHRLLTSPFTFCLLHIPSCPESVFFSLRVDSSLLQKEHVCKLFLLLLLNPHFFLLQRNISLIFL